jgi:hypothetical protein
VSPVPHVSGSTTTSVDPGALVVGDRAPILNVTSGCIFTTVFL